MQASDWFFEQLGEDLQAYAKHAGRKTIDESDVLTLMKRQVTIYQWVSRLTVIHADIFQTTSDQPEYYTIRSRTTPPPEGVAARAANAAPHCPKKAPQGKRRGGGRRCHLNHNATSPNIITSAYSYEHAEPHRMAAYEPPYRT
jgi:hypothetical protein